MGDFEILRLLGRLRESGGHHHAEAIRETIEVFLPYCYEEGNGNFLTRLKTAACIIANIVLVMKS